MKYLYIIYFDFKRSFFISSLIRFRHISNHKVCKMYQKKYNHFLSSIYRSTNQDIWQIEVDTTMKMIGVSFTEASIIQRL